MPGKKEEGYNVSELGNWNVASDYSRLKIMKPLDFCDHYENIARFGYDTLIEQLEQFGIPTDTLKLIGFERLISELLKICGNVEFAMKVSGTKEELEKLKKKLIEIRGIIPMLSKTITKKRKPRLVLNNDKYYKTAYKLHNLDRTKNQFKLVDSISDNFEEMNEIALNEFKKLNQK